MSEKPSPHAYKLSLDATSETYEQHHWQIVELLGRMSAQAATNYRTEQPRTEAYIGKQEEVIAALGDVMELMEA